MIGLSTYAGMEVRIIDAQQQARTARDVRGPRVRPKVPSKAIGRRGTRRAWKRANQPHFVMYYREPDDLLVLDHWKLFGPRPVVIATPAQADALRRATREAPTRNSPFVASA